jgi:tetratricopeptide (TPR) repeat protein
MFTRTRIYFGLTTLLLLGVVAVAAAQWRARPARQASTAIASSSSASLLNLAAPPLAGQGVMLTPRPRLLTPQDAKTPSTARTSPPGNFPFQTVTSSDHLVTLHYYYRSAENANGVLAEIVSILHDRLQARLGLTLKRNVDIWVYNSRAEFLAGTNPDSPQITGAYTEGDGPAVYAPLFPGVDSVSLFAHKLTHVVVIQNDDLGQLAFDLYPIWPQEGLAESSVPDDGIDAAYDDAAVRYALYNGRFVDIFTVFANRYPQDPVTDGICYAEARAFLKYMSAAYGQAKFQGFMRDILDGEIDYASLNNFGVDLPTLKGQWLTSLGIAAPGHPSAVFPTLATPPAFTPSTLSGMATQTRPFAAEGGENLLFDPALKLGVLLGLLALIVAILELSLRAVRRRRARREALAVSLALPSWESAPTSVTEGAEAPPSSEPRPLGVAAPTTVALSSVAPPAPRRRLVGARVWELVAFALLLPVVFGVGALESRLDKAQLWRHAYLTAGIAALASVVIVGALLWRAFRAYRNPSAHVVVLIALLAVAGLAYLDGQSAGVTQGRWFDDHGAYTLAYLALRDASASRADLHKVQLELADFARNSGDYAAAVQHYHLAIGVAPTSGTVDSDRAARFKTTQEWGDHLVAAHDFEQALAVYHAALISGDCVADCPGALQDASGAAYIGWAQDLIVAKRMDDANATLQSLVRAFPETKAAASAKLALDAAAKGLAPALAARKSGDITAMNLILQRIAYGQTASLDAAIATGFSQPVKGQITASYLYGAKTHLMLVAFATDAQARAYLRGHPTDAAVYDPIVFRIASVTDANGQFTAYAPAGYTYVPVWEATSRDGRPGWHYTSGKSFHVDAFTSVTVTAIRP